MNGSREQRAYGSSAEHGLETFTQTLAECIEPRRELSVIGFSRTGRVKKRTPDETPKRGRAQGHGRGGAATVALVYAPFIGPTLAEEDEIITAESHVLWGSALLALAGDWTILLPEDVRFAGLPRDGEFLTSGHQESRSRREGTGPVLDHRASVSVRADFPLEMLDSDQYGVCPPVAP
jgi:hypothetical protein